MFDLSIHGFEIKASRQDWQQELRNPLKAEIGAGYCDGWSLLTYPGVADPEEIPPSWGHAILDKSIKILKEPQPLNPKPVDRPFLAKLMDTVIQQAAQNVEILSSQADYDRGFAEGKQEGYDQADKAQGYLQRHLTRKGLEIERLNARLRAFQADGYREEDIEYLKAVAKFCRQFGPHRMGDILRTMEMFGRADLADLRKQLEDLHETSADITRMLAIRLGTLSDLGSQKEEEKT